MPLLCPLNVAEGRSRDVLAALRRAAGAELLDIHVDPHHHRAVLTLVGEEAPRRVASVAVDMIDLGLHQGVHPRFGVVDVVPFVPWGESTLDDVVSARARFLAWAAATLGLPGFAYGIGGPSLPEVRKQAFRELAPTAGPPRPHPTAGAVAVGARGPLVAYNVWLAQPDLAVARRVAAAVRGTTLRALGLQVGDRVQVSMNLVEPGRTGPAAAYDAVAELAATAGAELVGLLPAVVLDAVPRGRWAELDLAADRTVEWRLAHRPPAGED